MCTCMQDILDNIKKLPVAQAGTKVVTIQADWLKVADIPL